VIVAGNCNHRACIPKLVKMLRTGVTDPVKVQPMADAIEAYEHLDKREVGWIETELKPAMAAEWRWVQVAITRHCEPHLQGGKPRAARLPLAALQ